VIWLFGLDYGVRLAAPISARPKAWQILDTLIGVVMLMLAASLVAEAWPALH
jgi:L-lysine exporter family protein LysE/ArgO